MKRIIICCDGTQNAPDQMDRDRVAPTNVVKISRAINEVDRTTQEDIPQIIFYDPGVGTGWLIKRAIEGISGTGISANIVQAYAFLCENYEEGDEIYCFGFSRGAYTVRSLCGMINRVGLIAKPKAKKQEYYDLAYKLYRITRPGQNRLDYFKSFKKRYTHKKEVKVKFLGVWDTVGSLGLPLFGNSTHEWNKHHQIYDLKDSIENAAHALAIDEQRKQFRPRFLFEGMVEKKLKQKWFLGTHSNIGGGYVDAGLSDIALQWMIDEAKSYGLKFNQDYINTHVFPDPLGEIRNSKTSVYRIMGTYIRTVNDMPIPIKDMHQSVFERFMEVTTDYQPQNTYLMQMKNVEKIVKKHSDVSQPAEKKIEGLDKKYKNTRKREKKSKGFFSKMADSLSISMVVFLCIWLIATLFYHTTEYGLEFTLQDWLGLIKWSAILFFKIVVVPLFIFIALLLLLVIASFTYSKIWQIRQQKKYMK